MWGRTDVYLNSNQQINTKGTDGPGGAKNVAEARSSVLGG